MWIIYADNLLLTITIQPIGYVISGINCLAKSLLSRVIQVINKFFLCLPAQAALLPSCLAGKSHGFAWHLQTNLGNGVSCLVAIC